MLFKNMESGTGIKEGTLYSSLPLAVTSVGSRLNVKVKQVPVKGIVQSFLKRHLPANRLLANEDDLTYVRIPLTNPPRRQKQNLVKKKQKKLKKSEKRKKLSEISKEDHSFDKHLPLHQLWKSYMKELIPRSSLSSGAMQAACQKLVKADLHGCFLTVQHSKCPSYIGLSGIVLQETRNVFTLITPRGKVKHVPKVSSIFTFPLHGHVFTVYGSHFRIRAGERSSKKFKSKPTTDL